MYCWLLIARLEAEAGDPEDPAMEETGDHFGEDTTQVDDSLIEADTMPELEFEEDLELEEDEEDDVKFRNRTTTQAASQDDDDDDDDEEEEEEDLERQEEALDAIKVEDCAHLFEPHLELEEETAHETSEQPKLMTDEQKLVQADEKKLVKADDQQIVKVDLEPMPLITENQTTPVEVDATEEQTKYEKDSEQNEEPESEFDVIELVSITS